MSEFGPTPLLTHPEVREAEERGELIEPIEAERLAYEFKVTMEELHVIADMVGEYVKYSDLVQSEYFRNIHRDEELLKKIKTQLSQGKSYEEKNIKEDLLQEYLNTVPEVDREEAERSFNIHFLIVRAEELEVPNKIQIRLEDLILLWQVDQKGLMQLIWDRIKLSQESKIMTVEKSHSSDTDEEKESGKNSDSVDSIKAQTMGQSFKLGLLLISHFTRLIHRISGFTKDQTKSIRAYGHASSEEIRNAIREISQLQKGILAANISKTPEIVMGSRELANIYEVEPSEVDELSGWLQEFYKNSFGEEITLGVEDIHDEHQDAVDKDFLTSYVNYRQELRSLYYLLNKGRIVETDYIRELIERALPELQKNPPTIVYFHGDFGTGKTALAIHIARTRLGKEPIIVSGSKFLDPERFTEEFRIQKLPINEFLMKLYKDMGQDKTIDDDTSITDIITDLVGSRDEMRQKILDGYREQYKTEDVPDQFLEDTEKQLDSLFSNQVQGRYVMGAMFSAMEEGRPLIIDEANAISPEVLIAFNDLLTKKIGETIHTRTDKADFKIKEGYCIMWTGNTGERYKNARFNNLDPASYSRVTPIEVRYLPNSDTYNSINADIERLDLQRISEITYEGTDVETFVKDMRNQATNDQIFQVLVTRLLNRRLGAELLVKSDDRYSIFKDLYRLAVGARMIMDLFEGSVDPKNFPPLGVSGIVGADETATLRQTLQHANLSMRELMDNIVGGYLDSGCNMDIEYYLWKFVERFDDKPKEQVIIYAILRKAQFFTDEGWPEYSDISGDGAIEEFKKRMSIDPLNSIEKYKRIRKNGAFTTLLETGGEYTLQYFSSIEMLQIVFGYLPPRKTEEYERIGRKVTESRSIHLEDEQMMRLVNQILEIIPRVANIENYETSEDCEKVINKLKELPIADKVKRDAMDDAEFLKGVNEFYDTLIRFAEGSGIIDEKTADSVLGGPLEGKTTLVKSIFKE